MGTDEGGEESMEERLPESSLKLWLLMDANRLVVAGGVLLGVFIGIAAVMSVDPTSFERAARQGDPVETLFQALVTVIVTGVTLVVSINSLVLSQELGSVGEKREEMADSTEFREDVAEQLATPVSPAEPAAFLREMLEATADRASTLGSAAADLAEQEPRQAITDYATHVERAANGSAMHLEGTEFGTFDVVSAALDFEYGHLLHAGNRLESVHGEAIEGTTSDRLAEVRALLHQYGPAREHIKTLYFQWELVDLSRAMLYTAVPALVVAVSTLLVLGDPRTVPGTTLGLSNFAWVVVGATTVALSPFAILVSYILRIATVAKYTISIGPFVLRERR